MKKSKMNKIKAFFKKIWSKLFKKKIVETVVIQPEIKEEITEAPKPMVVEVAPTVIIKEVDHTVVPTSKKKIVKKVVKKTVKKANRKKR